MQNEQRKLYYEQQKKVQEEKLLQVKMSNDYLLEKKKLDYERR